MDIANLDFTQFDVTSEIGKIQFKNLLKSYNLKSVESFENAFNSCCTILSQLRSNLSIASEISIIEETLFKERAELTKEIVNEKKNIIESLVSKRSLLELQKSDFQKELDIRNYFDNYITTHSLEISSEQLWKWFQSYVREDDYNNNNYISDGLHDSETLKKAKELLDVAKKELSSACVVQKKVSGDLNNIFTFDELRQLHDKFALFNYIRAIIDDDVYKLRLTEIRFSDSSPDKLEVIFSEQIETIDGQISTQQEILEQSASIATSYSYTTKQANKGASALNTFDSMRQDGLNSSMYLLKNSDSEEVIMDNTGIWCKSMTDEGYYSPKQLRLISNGLYISTDGFNTVDTAIGCFKYNNEWVYGVNTKYIIGELIASKHLKISDTKGTIDIDENGIHLHKGAVIDWGNDGNGVNPPSFEQIDGIEDRFEETETLISNFQTNVNKLLNAELPVTSIGSDYVFSPYIGGGYLYIQKDGCSVEIDPSQSHDENNDKLIHIVSNNTDIFYGKRDGTGYLKGDIYADNGYFGGELKSATGDFSGKITAESGQIAAFNIINNHLTTGIELPGDNPYDTKGTYLGREGVVISGTNGDYAMLDDGTLILHDESQSSSNGIRFSNSINKNIYSFKMYYDINNNEIDGCADRLVISGHEKLMSTLYIDTNLLKIRGKSYFCSGITINNESGTGGTQGISTITIGNETSLASSHNSRGRIRLYGAGGNSDNGNFYAQLQAEKLEQNLTFSFPVGMGGVLAVSSSDKRLKNNIQDSEINAIELINKIKLRQFDWNDLPNNGILRNTHQSIGFIADELEELDCRLANGGGWIEGIPDDQPQEMNIKSVDMFYLLGYVVKAIQELSDKLDSIEERK